MVRFALVVLRWRIKSRYLLVKSRYLLDVPTIRGFFHWQYSQAIIPLFFATGVGMALAHEFTMAYAFFTLFGVWCLLFWLTSATLADRRKSLRSRATRRATPNKQAKQIREYNLLKWVVSFIVVIISVGFIQWTRKLAREMNAAQPRAYLHVDGVSIEMTPLENPGAYPWYITAHIAGHNVSTSVPTVQNPIVKACVRVRPFITDASEEKTLFVEDGCWVGGAYMGLNHVLNPLEPFGFSKTEVLAFLGGQDNSKGAFSFDTAKKIQHGDFVVYVVTRAWYGDRWGAVGSESDRESCSVFSVKDSYRREMCWGRYQQ